MSTVRAEAPLKPEHVTSPGTGAISKSSRPRWASDGVVAALFLLPTIVVFGSFVAYPIVRSAILSFQHWQPFGPATWIGLQNYRSALSDKTFQVSLENSLRYALYTIPVGLVWAIGTALAVSKLRGQTVWRTLLFLPSVVSTTSVAILWAWLLDPTIGLLHHLLNTGNILGSPSLAMYGLAAAVVWSNTGYWMVIFLAGLMSIPQEYYEAATVDGASAWQRFRQITMPLLSPTIFFYLTVAFSTVWFLFTRDYVLTSGGPGSSTLLPALEMYTVGFGHLQLSLATAMAWITAMIAFLLIGLNFFVARWWVHYEY